jgi:hypothetical protein
MWSVAAAKCWCEADAAAAGRGVCKAGPADVAAGGDGSCVVARDAVGEGADAMDTVDVVAVDGVAVDASVAAWEC